MNNKTVTIVVVAVVIVSMVILALAQGFDFSNPATPTPTPTATTSPTTSPTTNPTAMKTPDDAVSAHKVTLKTSKGDINLTLYPENTPMTVTNFATLGKRGYYNGIIFHRVIKDFVIQGGDPTGTGTGGESIYGQEFPNELNTEHQFKVGSLAMANAGKDTNGSQFFIVTEAGSLSALTPDLYTLFGEVSDDASMQVVHDIAAVPTDANDKPVDDVKITGFEITQP
jgi:cyclophilin family peptidyl-prolyl cis-trans isomerase